MDRPSSDTTVVSLLREGVLDDELAGLTWLLLDGGVPLIVASPDGGDGARRVASGLLMLAPGDVQVADLATGGARLIREASRGGGLPARLVVTLEADRLEAVIGRLRAREVGLDEDQVSAFGLVCIVSSPDGSGAPARIVAAHYLRPLSRDAHGHLQRLPPAVVATWGERPGRFEHFAWGIAGELAARVGRRTGDFEQEREQRSSYLAGLAATSVTAPAAVSAALAGFRRIAARDRAH